MAWEKEVRARVAEGAARDVTPRRDPRLWATSLATGPRASAGRRRLGRENE